MKAVVIHVDPQDGSLKISTSQNLTPPSGALDVLALKPNQLASLPEAELAGRLTGTVFGLLKAMYGDAFKPPHNYAKYSAGR
jgi:hypothetical protein